MFSCYPRLGFYFYSIPFLWFSTGMFWVSGGDKRLAFIVVIVFVFSLVFSPRNVFENLVRSVWIRLIGASMVFGFLSYFYHGFGSRELRGLAVAFLLLLSLPSDFDVKKIFLLIVPIASVNCFLLSFYYGYLFPVSRADWPVNAIPFSTHAAFVAVTSISSFFIFKPKRLKALMALSFLLALAAVFLTQTRGVFLALGFSALITVVFFSFSRFESGLNFSGAVILLLFVAFAFYFSFSAIHERYQSTLDEIQSMRQGDFDTSIGLRLQMYQEGLKLIRGAVFLGHGKTLQPYFDGLLESEEIGLNLHRYMSINFHNGFIEKAVVSGLIGVFLMLSLLIYPFFIFIRRGGGIFFCAALLALVCFLSNLTDTPFTNGHSILSYLIFVGLLLGLQQERYMA